MEGFKKGAQPGAGVASHGEAMGFKRGGQVKSSPQFRTKTSKMDSMDDGVQPARRGRNAQEVEAGGTKRMTPGYKEGGYVKCKKGGRTAYRKGGKYYTMGKGGAMKPYQKGGEVEVEVVVGNKSTRKSNSGTMTKKAKGGRVASAAHKTHSMPDRSQGEHVQPAQRGAKHVGKGGKTGKHRTGRLKD